MKIFEWENIYKEAMEMKAGVSGSSVVVATKVLRKRYASGEMFCEAQTFADIELRKEWESEGCGCCRGGLDGQIVGYFVQLFDADLNILKTSRNGALYSRGENMR